MIALWLTQGVLISEFTQQYFTWSCLELLRVSTNCCINSPEAVKHWRSKRNTHLRHIVLSNCSSTIAVGYIISWLGPCNNCRRPILCVASTLCPVMLMWNTDMLSGCLKFLLEYLKRVSRNGVIFRASYAKYRASVSRRFKNVRIPGQKDCWRVLCNLVAYSSLNLDGFFLLFCFYFSSFFSTILLLFLKMLVQIITDIFSKFHVRIFSTDYTR